jgi:hypothetical protein
LKLNNKDTSQLIEYFHRLCKQISVRSKQQLLILVDGLQDVHVEKAQLGNAAGSSVAGFKSDPIAWLFYQQLPARVHLIVSIKRSIESNTVNTGGMVPLFLHFFNEKLSSESENYLFELPVQLRKTDSVDVVAFINTELARADRKLKEDQIQLISSSFLASKQTESTSFSNISLEDKNSFFFLRLLLKEVINANRLNNNLSEMLLHPQRFPKDLDAFLNLKLDALESKFNTEMLKCIFSYLTGAHNGLTEMELIDFLSCNNEFFTQYYADMELPALLRFPLFQWLLIKYQLGDLLVERYMDLKVTYSWNHDYVKKFIRQRYFGKLDKVKTFHKDMANYFLESFVETKPLIDMNRNMQIR